MQGEDHRAKKNEHIGYLDGKVLLDAKKPEADDRDGNAYPNVYGRAPFYKKPEDRNEKNVKSGDKGRLAGIGAAVNSVLLERLCDGKDRTANDTADKLGLIKADKTLVGL